MRYKSIVYWVEVGTWSLGHLAQPAIKFTISSHPWLLFDFELPPKYQVSCYFALLSFLSVPEMCFD
jgi:hypothetical protein